MAIQLLNRIFISKCITLGGDSNSSLTSLLSIILWAWLHMRWTKTKTSGCTDCSAQNIFTSTTINSVTHNGVSTAEYRNARRHEFTAGDHESVRSHQLTYACYDALCTAMFGWVLGLKLYQRPCLKLQVIASREIVMSDMSEIAVGH